MSDYELMVFDEFEYDPETGVLTSDIHELKLYIVNGFYRTKINGNATSIHLLIHDLLGIDRTGMMVVHDDGNKLNTVKSPFRQKMIKHQTQSHTNRAIISSYNIVSSQEQ